MGRVQFTKFTRFEIDKNWYQIDSVLINNNFSIANISQGGVIVKSLNELMDLWQEGKLQFEYDNNISSYGPEKAKKTAHVYEDFCKLPSNYKDEAWRRYQIIIPLLENNKMQKPPRSIIKQYVNELRKESGIIVLTENPEPLRKNIPIGKALSTTSVEKWIKDFINSGYSIESLVPCLHKINQKGTTRLQKEVEEIIAARLDYYDKHRGYQKVDDVYLDVVSDIDNRNLTRPKDDQLRIPNKKTIYNRIKKFGRENILRRRRSRSEEQPNEPKGVGQEATRALEEVQFDETKLDFIVVDDFDRFPIGRLVFGAGIDKCTSYPTSIITSLENSSANTVADCILYSILKKPDTQKIFGTINKWEPYGLMERIKIDCGTSYLNSHITDALGRLGVIVQQCTAGSPWEKGNIENYIKSVGKDVIFELPGSTFANVIERGDYQSEKLACISKSAITRILHHYVIDICAQSPNLSKMRTPAAMWEESMKRGFIPCLPPSVQLLRVLLYRTENRKLGPNGIEFETLYYQGDDKERLRSILKNDELEVVIKINPRDISHIFVLDPITKKDWLKFTSKKTEYTNGLSLWKHQINRKFVLERMHAEVDIHNLALAHQTIRNIVQHEYESTKKLRGRSKMGRYLDCDPLLNFSELPTKIHDSVTQIIQLPDGTTIGEQNCTADQDFTAPLPIVKKFDYRENSLNTEKCFNNHDQKEIEQNHDSELDSKLLNQAIAIPVEMRHSKEEMESTIPSGERVDIVENDDWRNSTKYDNSGWKTDYGLVTKNIEGEEGHGK